MKMIAIMTLCVGWHGIPGTTVCTRAGGTSKF